MRETNMDENDASRLDAQLQQLHLQHIQGHYQALAGQAAEKQLSHVGYLAQLIEGEATLRENRSIKRRIDNARFPVLNLQPNFDVLFADGRDLRPCRYEHA